MVVVSHLEEVIPSARDTMGGQSFFEARIRGVEGVLAVETEFDDSTGNRAFSVFVGDGDRNAETMVGRLVGETYRLFPDVHLDVVVLRGVPSLLVGTP
jgi:hypothetical protein